MCNGLRDMEFMLETENYSALVEQGKPVAVFKTRKNIDGTFSNYVELFNCSEEHAAFIQMAVQMAIEVGQAGGRNAL